MLYHYTFYGLQMILPIICWHSYSHTRNGFGHSMMHTYDKYFATTENNRLRRFWSKRLIHEHVMSQFETHTPFKKLYVSKVNKHRRRWGYFIRIICTRNISHVNRWFSSQQCIYAFYRDLYMLYVSLWHKPDQKVIVQHAHTMCMCVLCDMYRHILHTLNIRWAYAWQTFAMSCPRVSFVTTGRPLHIPQCYNSLVSSRNGTCTFIVQHQEEAHDMKNEEILTSLLDIESK